MFNMLMVAADIGERGAFSVQANDLQHACGSSGRGSRRC